MSNELEISELQKAEKRLVQKGCKKMTGELWRVPISVLKIDQRFCFRRSRNSKVLKSLAEDIEKKGMLNLPVAIYPIETDEIVLAVGFGRVACLKKNNKECIPCRIFISNRMEPQEIFNLIISDNIHREDMKPIELALLFRSWMKESGLSQKELAEKIHRSETYVSEILSPLTKLSEKEIELILTSELRRSQIMELAKVEDKEKRVELIERKASVREIRDVISKQENKEKKYESRIFRFSNKAVRSSLGNVEIDLLVKFPKEGWDNKDVVEILAEFIKKLRESSEQDSHLIPESFNF